MQVGSGSDMSVRHGSAIYGVAVRVVNYGDVVCNIHVNMQPIPDLGHMGDMR